MYKVLIPCFVGFILFSSQSGLANDTDVDSFVARYLAAVKPIRDEYRRCSYTGSIEIFVPGESQNPRRSKRFHVFAKDDRLRLDLSYPSEADATNTTDACKISHPDKCFSVAQNPTTGKFFVNDILFDTARQTMKIRGTGLMVDAPFSVRGALVEDFLALPNVHVTSIGEDPAKRGYVRVEFAVTPTPGQTAERNWLLFDSNRSMVLVEYCVGNAPVTSRYELEYDDVEGKIPIVKSMKSYERWDRNGDMKLTNAYVIDSFVRKAPADKVFTLAAFGLYERSGFQIHWYVWLAIASVAILVIRALIMRFRQSNA